MSRSSVVELDFFRIEQQNAEKNLHERPVDQRRNLRGIQNAISRIDPQLLKSVFASRPVNGGLNGSLQNEVQTAEKSPITMQANHRFNLPLPVLSPVFRPVAEDSCGTAPLTIFYNGTVTVFDVPRDQAERIIKIAESENISATAESAETNFMDSSSHGRQLLEKLNGGDLPIARKHSLQRFLEKRKERLTSDAPYPSLVDKKSIESVGAQRGWTGLHDNFSHFFIQRQ